MFLFLKSYRFVLYAEQISTSGSVSDYYTITFSPLEADLLWVTHQCLCSKLESPVFRPRYRSHVRHPTHAGRPILPSLVLGPIRPPLAHNAPSLLWSSRWSETKQTDGTKRFRHYICGLCSLCCVLITSGELSSFRPPPIKYLRGDCNAALCYTTKLPIVTSRLLEEFENLQIHHCCLSSAEKVTGTLHILVQHISAALSHETLTGKFVRKNNTFIISRKYPSKPVVTKFLLYLPRDYVGVIRSLFGHESDQLVVIVCEWLSFLLYIPIEWSNLFHAINARTQLTHPTQTSLTRVYLIIFRVFVNVVYRLVRINVDRRNNDELEQITMLLGVMKECVHNRLQTYEK